MQRGDFEKIEAEVASFWNLATGIPRPTGLPFNSARVQVSAGSGFQQFFMVGPDFGTVLKTMTREFADRFVSAVVVRPSPDELQSELGFYPAFELAAEGIDSTWGTAVREAVSGEEIDSLLYQADTIGLVGSSGSWGVWSDRSWSIGWVAACRPAAIDFSDSDVDFYPLVETFEFLARPPKSLSADEFRQIVNREFGQIHPLHVS